VKKGSGRSGKISNVVARHEVPKQSQVGQKEKKHSVISRQQSVEKDEASEPLILNAESCSLKAEC